MDRSNADRILAEWDRIAREASRPAMAQPTVVTTTPRGPAMAGILVVAMAVSAVGLWAGLSGNLGGSTDPGASPNAVPSASPVSAGSIPRCEDVPSISAPADRYRDSPIYVANEQPTEEVRAWAAGQPGFEDLWLDRDHLGWITLAFSVEADARQAELEQLFPDVGVVAVEVDWVKSDLDALKGRVVEEIAPLFSMSAGVSITQGVVTVGVGVLTAERINAVESRFAGEPVCIDGVDPAAVPVPGPQPLAGDGWRLVLDQKALGLPYRTGVAWDQASYERLWREIGASETPPPIDFESEVAIWFGAVYGSGCPGIRLDDVVVRPKAALVHATIVLVDQPGGGCTDDANPHAYVVALERARLPAGPFAIQLGAADPPGGFPEERTIVTVDLSRPGSISDPSQVHPDTSTPEPHVLEPGSFLEPGFETPFRMSVHCGIEWLGRLNDVEWRTDVPDGPIGYVPPPWKAIIGAGEVIDMSIVLVTDPEPVITATANDHALTYRPTAEVPPGCV